jgi:hypothetical protein
MPNPNPDAGVFDQLVIPRAGGEVIVPARNQITALQLNMGYGPKSIDILQNIPNLPNLYKLEIDLNNPNISQYIADNYRTNLGVISTIDVDGKYNGLQVNINDPLRVDTKSVSGICGGDDWYMVVTDKSLKKDDTVRIWVLFTKTGAMPRFFYTDIVLPEPFETIHIEPDFAAIPIVDESFFRLMLMAHIQDTTQSINQFLPAPFNVFTNTEHYVLTKKEYDFSKYHPMPASAPGLSVRGLSITAPLLSSWDPTPKQTISGSIEVLTSDIFSDFNGIFDGANYTITGLKYMPQSASVIANFGFFGRVSDGTVKNLNLVIADVSDAGVASSVLNFGGLAGQTSNAVIEGISVRTSKPGYQSGGPPYLFDEITHVGTKKGGIVGSDDGTTDFSANTQSVSPY